MALLRHPLYSILVVIVIGVGCGLLARLIVARGPSGETFAISFTAMCVGLAGAFLGFHFAMLSNMATDQAMIPFIVALMGSVLLLWGGADCNRNAQEKLVSGSTATATREHRHARVVLLDISTSRSIIMRTTASRYAPFRRTMHIACRLNDVSMGDRHDP